MSNHLDRLFLHHALSLAARGLGRTMPNPSVGCVLVKDGAVLAATRTADGGRPHAETQALAMAGDAARGSTAYVTLEPCAHHGQTPPCAEALIAAGVARVLIGCMDSDPRVSGRGVAMLEAAGITVEKMLLPEAAALNRGFFRRIAQGLPHVACKLATSLDGLMTDATGASQWITGAVARAHGNGLRAKYDAILTGIGTVLTDDPAMTSRAPNPSHAHLIRVVADRQLRLPLHSKLVKSANQQPVWVITSAESVELAASHATELREAGVKFLVVENGEAGRIPPPLRGRLGGGRDGTQALPTEILLHAESLPHSAPLQPSPYGGGGAPSTTADASLSPEVILRALAAEGITRLLIEAGPALSTAFLAANTVETLHWYRAPILLGNAGKAAVGVLDSTLPDAARLTLAEKRALGGDVYERYESNACSPV